MRMKVIPFFIVPALAAYACTRPLYARAEDYTYTDICIDWIDNCIGLLSPVELTLAPVISDVNAMQIAKQELRQPTRAGNLSDACGGSVGYYYNNDGTLRMASVPTDFDTSEHITTSACICTSPDFSVYVSQVGYPDTDSFYMTYYSTTTTCGVHMVHSGSSSDWYRVIEVDAGNYFVNSPWQFTANAITCNVGVGNLRSSATIPTISPSYTPPYGSTGMSLTLFGQGQTTAYPANISDVAIYQLYTPAVLHAWLSEVAVDLETNAPGLDLPPVPSPSVDPTEPIQTTIPYNRPPSYTDESGNPVTETGEDYEYNFALEVLPSIPNETYTVTETVPQLSGTVPAFFDIMHQILDAGELLALLGFCIVCAGVSFFLWR